MTGQGIPYYTVDAFTDTPFAGNPAAVCLEIDALSDAAMGRIAREMNLSETAFVHRAAEDGLRRLRWFTPTVEVPLCGHATLASAHVLLRELGGAGPVRFSSASGPLTVHTEGDRLRMDFPSNPPLEGKMPRGLAAALGVGAVARPRRGPGQARGRGGAAAPRSSGAGSGPLFAASGKVALVVLGTEAEVVALRPDFGALGRVALPGGLMGVAATAPGADPAVDFVSRFFAPWVGVDEDPVTGVAHTTLTPYWAARLGKSEMSARSAPRGAGISPSATAARAWSSSARRSRWLRDGSAPGSGGGRAAVPGGGAAAARVRAPKGRSTRR